MKGLKSMRKYRILNILSNCFMLTAMASIVSHSGHCIIILHQPDIPEKLKKKICSFK